MWPEMMNYYSKTTQATLDTMQQHKESGWNASLPIYAGFESKGWIALPRILVNLAIPALKGSAQKLVEQQTQVNQTVVACSLERYRTAHG